MRSIFDSMRSRIEANLNPEYLEQLSTAATFMLRRGKMPGAISQLRADLEQSNEPFVWTSVGLRANDSTLPDEIQSAWLFALKANTWTGEHFHPNSVQHMIVIEGKGRARIEGVESRLIPFDPGAPSDDQWCVIDSGVPHEFYPEGEDMIVMSFHTAPPGELVEVSVNAQRERRYSS